MGYKKNNKIILLIYILGFIIIASSIALYQPLANTPPLFGNPPDEHARYLIPKYICDNGRIPTGFEEEVRIPDYGFSYGLYNVFPYIVQGLTMRLVSMFTNSEYILLYTARFVNVISGTLMAVVVYLLAKRLFQDKRFLWIFCFAVMYLPQSLFMHTYVNTDSMCLLSTAMMLLGLVGAYQEGFNKANSLWLCAGIIICALSYYNAYGYILSSILLFIVYFLHKKDGRWHYNWKKMLKTGSIISVIVLLGIGWWFIRSYLLFDGDFIGLQTRDKMAILYAVESVNPLTMNTYQSQGYSILEMMRETKFLQGAYISFVAAFGSMRIFGNIWIYRLYKVFFTIGTLGCVIPWNMIPWSKGKGFKNINGKKVFFHINMIFCMVMPLILLIHYAYTTDFQNQGRYLLPAIIPLMYYMARGFQKLAGRSWVPYWLQNVGVAICFIILIGGTLWMVYGAAFPVYLTTGVVM